MKTVKVEFSAIDTEGKEINSYFKLRLSNGNYARLLTNDAPDVMRKIKTLATHNADLQGYDKIGVQVLRINGYPVGYMTGSLYI